MLIEKASLKDLKKYKIKYITTINDKEESYSMDFDLGYSGEKIEFYLNVENLNEDDDETINYFLNKTNEIFNVITYKLKENGEVDEVLNTVEILNKWNKTKKEFLENNQNKEIFDIIFELNGIINSKEKLSEILKRYNIIPYLTLGFYNTELSKIRPFRLNGILYNMYLLENIPVQFDIYGETIENEKKILITGKETNEFDRIKYKNKIIKNFSNVDIKKIGTFDLKCNGNYTFNLDNTLKELNFQVLIEIQNLVQCNYTYLIKEREE